MSDDVTLKVLIDIREGIAATNQRVDLLRADMNEGFAKTHDRIDRTNGRIDQLRNEVRDDLREVEIRQSTSTMDLTAATRNLYTMLEENFALRDRVERCEQDIADLKKSRLTVLRGDE